MKLSPDEAYKKILQDGPFDDPRRSHNPLRWHWWKGVDGEKYLACSEWRGDPEIYTQFKKPEKKKRQRCHNCKFAGESFKIAGKTHMHCEHPKWKPEDMESGKISPWDTLQEFWETCKDHEFKTISNPQQTLHKPAGIMESLRNKFKAETGDNWENSQGEPDIDYVE